MMISLIVGFFFFLNGSAFFLYFLLGFIIFCFYFVIINQFIITNKMASMKFKVLFIFFQMHIFLTNAQSSFQTFSNITRTSNTYYDAFNDDGTIYVQSQLTSYQIFQLRNSTYVSIQNLTFSNFVGGVFIFGDSSTIIGCVRFSTGGNIKIFERVNGSLYEETHSFRHGGALTSAQKILLTSNKKYVLELAQSKNYVIKYDYNSGSDSYDNNNNLTGLTTSSQDELYMTPDNSYLVVSGSINIEVFTFDNSTFTLIQSLTVQPGINKRTTITDDHKYLVTPNKLSDGSKFKIDIYTFNEATGTFDPPTDDKFLFLEMTKGLLSESKEFLFVLTDSSTYVYRNPLTEGNSSFSGFLPVDTILESIKTQISFLLLLLGLFMHLSKSVIQVIALSMVCARHALFLIARHVNLQRLVRLVVKVLLLKMENVQRISHTLLFQCLLEL